MAQYMISVWHDDEYVVDFSGDEIQRRVRQVTAFNEALTESGAFVFGGGLNPKSTATTLRFAEGSVAITDGPFAESKEQIGGFWVIEVADMDAALDWARRAALACEENLELRPFQTESPE